MHKTELIIYLLIILDYLFSMVAIFSEVSIQCVLTQ